MLNRTLSVAPMLDCTDRHYRYFLRLLSLHILLYTEMITTGAILYGKNREKFLSYDPIEHPLALQLGGSDPVALAKCAQIAEDYGYDEINLNVGCPSDRVKSGQFGACLMAKPDLVAECVAAMGAAVNLPITVKTRIGIDEQDSYDHLVNFVNTVANAGCQTFIIHARKAWLQGLSPKENREIPPLRYEIVRQLKEDFPKLQIILNGGIKDLTQAQQLLTNFDGVMMGRAVYHNPYLLAMADKIFYQDAHGIDDQATILNNYVPYLEHQLAVGVKLSSMVRHLIGLFHGMPGALAWRRYLSENMHKAGAGIEVLQEAVKFIY